jgi:hypothetical protein
MISIGPSVTKNNIAPTKKKNKKKSILPLERTATPMITVIVGRNIIWIWTKLSKRNDWTQERPAEGGKEEDVYATIADSSSTSRGMLPGVITPDSHRLRLATTTPEEKQAQLTDPILPSSTMAKRKNHPLENRLC